MSIELDVHGYSIDETIYTIQRVIVRNPSLRCIEVIHGYNKGNAIKKILENKQNIHSKRVIKTSPVPFNLGRTFIYLK